MLPLRTALAIAFAASLASSQVRPATPFSIQEVLSSPFPSELRASPRGDAIAWVFYAQGVRNIWVARAPGFEAAPITTFSADDGQDISELAWKADSSAVFFTRGGDPNARGEFPNPSSNPAGARQEVWIAPVAGGARRLADGHGAAAAPDGSQLAWISNGQVWSVSLNAADAQPAQLIRARGGAEDLTWSPDSRRLAFRSSRVDHSFIGVYDFLNRTLQFPDPSVDRDQSAEWSPDGTKLAFIRLPASRYAAMHGAKRTGDPWSIRVTDLETGKAKEIWRAAEGMGSVFWPMVARNQLLWSASGRIVFPWERDGWLHLYAVAEGGGNAQLLTPGDFEVEHVSLSVDRKSVSYSSNEADSERRHVWSADIAAGKRKALTSGPGLEWLPASLASGAVALLHSDARLPARPALLEGSAIRDLAPSAVPSDFPANSMVEPQPVTFRAADGMTIHGQLFLPAAPTSAVRRPAVIFFHGGSRRQMLLGWHSMFYYHQTYGFNQFLASRGFVVLSVNYRSGTGYGEAFREALNYGPTGASEYNDVLGAQRFLVGRSDVDAARIGVWGGSYGGYLAALGLARDSKLFAAGVDLHGVHDWNLEINNFVPVYEPEKRLEIAKTAFESSPMASVAAWKSPVLLIHGDDDRNVPFSESVQLVEQLRHHQVPFEQIVFPDEVHDFLIHAHWVAAYEASYGFLQQTLKR